ncbi:alpha/beta hydrolase family protein [Myceligenerans pegani]|uniref:Alpha/beta hydrolase n=1 Tax=Myceligenerans pegani TaxID=2776917 RepID=A0ABR9N0X7_9MICO|nr:alpha/beta hydrolase [Myceligenerans sp. TRM 65318]MBE1877308.1 alpha/beta hydrolase [Myceligenerans sp. TRM 65318]MBE3019579.1 alpha/beta hydrolase [Myceligenerans sp. TRM 65318]
MTLYDPFAVGPYSVTRSTDSIDLDTGLGRPHPVETWAPAETPTRGPAGTEAPTVLFSHRGGAHRGSASFLCAHLASHGYRVLATDHAETVDETLGGARPGEDAAGRAARADLIARTRVVELRTLLERAVADGAERIGVVGHSIGGWTALTVAQADPRVDAVVAIAPAGGSDPRPGVYQVTLDPVRSVPTLYLTGAEDVSTRLAGIRDMVSRTPDPVRLVVLDGADHYHFADDVGAEHEAIRSAADTVPLLSWVRAMRQLDELIDPAVAHAFAQGLTLAHLDATLRDRPAAAALLSGDLTAALAARGIPATEPERAPTRG